jgi:peptidoglycan/LPS O-acetylase OafA/YrhL
MFGAVLSQKLRSDRNSFNLVRLAAASAVIVSHLPILRYGPGTSEPLSSETPFTLGQHAVNIFFVLSGLLLSRSLEKSPDLRRFAVARILRIAPALFAYGVVLALVAGPGLTTVPLGEYFANIYTWTYPVIVMALFQRAPAPPGLFAELPFASAVNEPLWTLKYEVMAYFGLGLAQAVEMRGSLPFLVLSLMLAVAGMLLTRGDTIDVAGAAWPYHLTRYGICFLLGVLAHRCRDVLPVTPWLLPVSLVAALAFRGTSLSPVIAIVVVAHLAIVAGSLNYGFLSRWTRANDISYGTYIYGWPVQQTIVAMAPGISLTCFAAWSFAVVLPLALFSWSVIEQPSLNYKSDKAA